MTDSYSVVVRDSVRAQIRRLPHADIERITHRLQGLGADPRPPGCVKLAGGHGYRLRQDDYRILYTVDDSAKSVDVYRVGNRREVYK